MNFKISTFVSYLTGFLIVVGIINQLLFYYFFGVPIYHYLEVGEVLMLFTTDIIILSCLFVFPIVVILLLFVLRKTNTDSITNAPASNTDHKYAVITGKFLVVLGILSFLTSITSLFFSRNTFQYVHAIVGIAGAIGFCVISPFQKYVYRNGKEKPDLFLYFSLCLSVYVIVIFTLYRTTSKAEKIYDGEHVGTLITTKDSTYISDSIHFFIGRTNNYSFIYNKLEKTATILPNNEILRIVLKTK